jgi:competence protein ComEC
MMKSEDKFKLTKIIIGVFIAVDFLVWGLILFPPDLSSAELYFLDVGQGDSSLVILPGGPKILIDGGPANGKLQTNLESILPINDRYLDLVMISHPQLDHFGGFVELLKVYKVGAVLLGGQTSESAAWQEMEKIIKDRGIARIVLSAGDKIKYQDSLMDILSPKKNEWAKDINDLSVVGILDSGGAKTFFGGDISAEKEKQLARLYDVDVDILKVSHHGSKFFRFGIFERGQSEGFRCGSREEQLWPPDFAGIVSPC